VIDFDDSKELILISKIKTSTKRVQRYRITGNENSVWTLQELAEALNVDESTVSNRLYAMGKIQKGSKWVPHELSEMTIQNCLTICILLLSRRKKKQFSYQIVTSDEKWIYNDNLKCKKLWVVPMILISQTQHLRK